MNANQRVAVTLLCVVSLLLAALLTGCARGKSDGVAAIPVGPDITAPTVNATTPSLAAAAAPNSSIKVLFSEAMDGATITAASFTLSQGTTPVLGDVTYDNKVATLKPIANLALDAVFTATINTSVTDAAGNALAANRSWTFTTRTTAVARRAVAATRKAG